MSYLHHIIPLHEWRRRINPDATRNDKEFNAPDNVVWLTLEQHIQAHHLLWKLNGNRFDEIAWQTLSGKNGKEEANRQAIIESNKTRDYKKQAVKQSANMMGNHYALGSKRTFEQNHLNSVRNIGNSRAVGVKWTPERRTAHIALLKAQWADGRRKRTW